MCLYKNCCFTAAAESKTMIWCHAMLPVSLWRHSLVGGLVTFHFELCFFFFFLFPSTYFCKTSCPAHQHGSPLSTHFLYRVNMYFFLPCPTTPYIYQHLCGFKNRSVDFDFQSQTFSVCKCISISVTPAIFLLFCHFPFSLPLFKKSKNIKNIKTKAKYPCYVIPQSNFQSDTLTTTTDCVRKMTDCCL